MRDLGLASAMLALLGISAAGRPFVGILAWSWISFMNPHQDVYGFASGQSWALFSFAATVIGCVLAGEPKKPAVNALTVLLALLAVWVTLTSLTAIGPSGPVWWKWDRTVKMIAGLLLTASMLTDRHRITALVWLLGISLGYYGLKGGIFTAMTGGGFQVLGPRDSLIADRNHIAVGMLVALPLINWLRLQARHRIARIILAITMLSTLLAVVGTSSRGALIGLAAVAAVLWLRSEGKVTSGIAIAVALAGVISFMPPEWIERMQSIKEYEADGSAMGRIRIWYIGWLIALERPILGGGFRAVYNQDIVNRYDPTVKARADHSIWVEALSEQGFAGFAIWLGIILVGTAYSFSIARATRDRPDLRWAYQLARMCQVSITAYVTGGSFLSLAYWDYFWTILVVLGATRALVAKALQATQPEAPDTSLAAAWRPGGGAARPAPALRSRP